MAFEFIYLNNTLIFFFFFLSLLFFRAKVFFFVVRLFAVMQRSFPLWDACVVACWQCGLRTERENIGTLQYYFSYTICRSMKSLLIVCSQDFVCTIKTGVENVVNFDHCSPRFSRIYDQGWNVTSTSCVALTQVECNLPAIYSSDSSDCVSRDSRSRRWTFQGRGKKYTSILFLHVCLSPSSLLFTGENFLPRNKFDCRFNRH